MTESSPPDVRSEHYTSADGLALFYRDHPGPPGAPVVLCLPGLTRNSRDFSALARRLGARYRLLAPDLRGRGESARDPNWRNYHPGTYVADAWRLLEHVGVRRCAILGTSLGGLMAMLMANEQRDRIAGAILNDVGPEIAQAGLQRILQYLGKQPPVASWEEAAAQAKAAYAITLPEYTDADWVAFARRSYREGPDGVPELDMDPNIGRALLEVGGTLPDPWETFDAMGVPTLVLRGEISDILSPEILGKMQAHRPDLEVAIIPDRGHVPQLDEPAAVAAIGEFLARLAW